MYSTCNYTGCSNSLLLCWCIYCLAEWFFCVPPAPYGRNTAAVGPLLSSGLTTAATYTLGLCLRTGFTTISVPCPVQWNLMWPLNVEMSCNDISFDFKYIMVVMYRTSAEPMGTGKLTWDILVKAVFSPNTSAWKSTRIPPHITGVLHLWD